MTDQPGPRRRTARWIIGGTLVLAMTVALLRGPSAPLFGGADAAQRVVTDIGQRRTVVLDEGTRVDLSVTTTLAFPDRFAAGQRAVTLTGEAFFTVTTDSARPFVVNAGHARVVTHGATFAVRAYPEQAATRVVVADGSVRLHANSGPDTTARLVVPLQLARVTRTGAFLRQDSVNTERLTAWRRGRIIFGGVPLRDALNELERWQDVDLRIADSVVANRRVTGEFTTLQTFTEILDEIALGIGAVYRWQGRVVTFRRER